MSELTLYELPPSPNNVKARIALGFKGLQLGEGCDRTREWVRAVPAHDPIAK